MPGVAGIPVQCCISEFVGTFLLVFTVGCNVLSGNGTWGAVSIACVLMVSIYALGAISGGHFNPAVSVALQLAKKLEKTGGWTQVAVYCAAQLCGGICAAGCYSLLFNSGFPLAPKPGHTLGALVCELLYTFMLCFVVLNTAASKAKGGNNSYYGLAIGFVIIAGGYGAGAVGAGCFNPAVALSIYISSFFTVTDPKVSACLLYVAAELVGAALAVQVFQLVRPEEKDQTEGLLPPPGAEGYSLRSKLVSEMVGTYMLVLTVGLNVLGAGPAAAFSIAASLTCMIYALGDVSGGHFNPAVTLAIQLCGKSDPNIPEACKYALAQVGGAVLAAFTYALIHNGDTFPLGPGQGYGWASVAVAEVVFTFVLTFVVLGVAVVDRQPASEFIGLIIGSTVTAGGFAIGGVSGGCLNPAVSIGIAASHILGGGFFYKAIFYTVCQMLGGVIAAGVFKIAYSAQEGSSAGVKIFVGEFIGTFLLVFTVGCNVLTGNATWGAVSIACVLMASIYAFAGVSGAHFNPAVTAALAIAGKLDKNTPLAKQIVQYVSAQISGGLVAALAYHTVFAKGFPLAPKAEHTSGAMLCELIYTFMLCFVVLNTAASKAIGGGKNQFFGLAIGFVIIAGGYGSGPLGAGCFNPAVAMSIFAGADFVDSDSEMAAAGQCLLYVLIEIVGAGLAAVLFAVVRPEEKDQHSEPPRDGEGYSLLSKLMSEFLGTFMLVFTVGLNVLGESKAAAFSIAASLTCMIYALGDVSGGHFNPAVTLAIEACGKNKPNIKEAALYIITQIAGAVVAALAYSFSHNGATFPLGPGAGHGWKSVAAAEGTFTFVLAFVVLCVAVVSQKPAPQFTGFIIGSCVTVGGFAIGGVSGGCLNPAVAVGIASSHLMGGGLFYKALIYAGVELLGGAAAAGLFRIVYEAELPKAHPSLGVF